MTVRLILPLVLLSLLGCSHLKGAFHPVEGEDFAAEKLDQIEEGTPVDEVLRLLGEPLQRQPNAQGEEWRYFVREERVDELRFLGLLPVRKVRWGISEVQIKAVDKHRFGDYRVNFGRNAVWLDFTDGHLRSAAAQTITGLTSARLSPKKDLCTGS